MAKGGSRVVKNGKRTAALLLALLMLCGCSRVQVPEEELQAAGKPIEGLPAGPQEPVQPETPPPPPVPLLEDGLCALLPGTEGTCVLYDRWGTKVATIPGGEELAGVYSADAILAGHRLSDGSPVLPQAGAEAEWLADESGFTVYDRAAGLLYRLAEEGELQFSCAVPPETEQIALLPLGRGFVLSLWRGSGSKTDPWAMTSPCVVLDSMGQVEQDLSEWIAAPVMGILGDALLLLARPGETLVDVYDRSGACLGEGLLPVPDQSLRAPLGGVLCRLVWQEGWLYAADMQKHQPCEDPNKLVAYGEQLSGTTPDIDGIPGNGQLLLCADGAAFWGLRGDTLAIQWQGVNYHFPAGKRRNQKLQLCSREMAVAWAWDDGGGSLRLLYFATGAVLEYDCPAGTQISALLGQGYALLAAADADGKALLRVVDAQGRLCFTDTRPLLPCAAGPYLLRREGGTCVIVGLDGTPLAMGRDG